MASFSGVLGAVLFYGTLNGPHPSQLLLQKGFGMAIGFVEGINSIFEIVKLTALMRRFGKDKSDRTANGLFSIGDDALDRHRQLVEQCLTSVSKAVRSPCVLRSLGRARRISSERQSRMTQRTSCPTSGCKPSSAKITCPCCCNGALIRC